MDGPDWGEEGACDCLIGHREDVGGPCRDCGGHVPPARELTGIAHVVESKRLVWKVTDRG